MTWLFECNGGKWGSFDAAATAKLEAAFAAETASVNLDTPHGTLQVSLETMQQTNAATGRVRKLRRVEDDEPVHSRRGIGIHHAGAELEPAKGNSGVKR